MINQRPKRKNRSRRSLDPSMLQTGNPAFPTAVDFATPNVSMTFAQPVVLGGLPTWLTNTNKIPISASIDTAHLVVTCVYDTPGSVTTVTVDPSDNAVKTRGGGGIPAGTFPAA